MKNKRCLLILILFIALIGLVFRFENSLVSDPFSVTSLLTEENTGIPHIPEPMPPSEETVDPDLGKESEIPEPQENVLATPEQESENSLHDGFLYIKEILPDAKLEIRYATSHNFTGKIVDGYLSDHVSLTVEAAEALKIVSVALNKMGYGIKIYDAYRPKQAVDFFIQWADCPEDMGTKAEFYPDYDKKELFSLGYLAKRSGHSRGSTVDLTLFNLDTGKDIDMGSSYDFLGPISNHGTTLITEEQTKNRDILKKYMNTAGFKELRTEWWHYGLINEPYPTTYFDFPVE